MDGAQRSGWHTGTVPIAVVMISLNEGHNMDAVCRNLEGWAQEVFLVDSYSQDDTVNIALRYGVHVVQRRFRGFGDQWNFALRELPITASWTMKLDPDERLSDTLKNSLSKAIQEGEGDAVSFCRRLYFMGMALPVQQTLVRLWRTGTCRFTEVAVNEHPIVNGRILNVAGELFHHDSPDLEHWLDKQNRYTTAEAIIAHTGTTLADTPRLTGTKFQRRMWLKKHYGYIPFRHQLMFLYNWLWQGTWHAGRVGYIWARLRSDVMRLIEYKQLEMSITGRVPTPRFFGPGKPDSRVPQYD